MVSARVQGDQREWAALVGPAHAKEEGKGACSAWAGDGPKRDGRQAASLAREREREN